MANTQPKPETRTIAQFTGFHGTTRILTKADQNRIVGVESGIGKEDLVWQPGNSKLDVTDAHEEVLAYLKSDSEFKLTSVEVTPEAPTS